MEKQNRQNNHHDYNFLCFELFNCLRACEGRGGESAGLTDKFNCKIKLERLTRDSVTDGLIMIGSNPLVQEKKPPPPSQMFPFETVFCKF